jgi:hypothetical protein
LKRSEISLSLSFNFIFLLIVVFLDLNHTLNTQIERTLKRFVKCCNSEMKWNWSTHLQSFSSNFTPLIKQTKPFRQNFSLKSVLIRIVSINVTLFDGVLLSRAYSFEIDWLITDRLFDRCFTLFLYLLSCLNFLENCTSSIVSFNCCDFSNE